MEDFDPKMLMKLTRPAQDSHKGQNGKLLVVGGSHLFHAASLWALGIASKLVDMVFYSSVPENNETIQKAKEEFRNGIVIPRIELDEYAKEADCILIGPGMNRSAKQRIFNFQFSIFNLENIGKIVDEGEQTYFLTRYLLEKYPRKKWVIDAGALQMIDLQWLEGLKGPAILTPHAEEFQLLKLKIKNDKLKNEMEKATLEDQVRLFARAHDCIVLLKGKEDLVASPEHCVKITGGNAGMTRGGTGDVLSGLVAGLACKNEMYLAAQSGSYINKKAGDSLFEKVGFAYNATDLMNEIPYVMKRLLF